MKPLDLDRRGFLQLAIMAGAGVAFGASGCAVLKPGASPAGAVFAPDAFLEIDSVGQVTIWISRQEMGQGVRTALPMIVAEELDADWSAIRIIQAPLGEQYGAQRTGGSLSIRELFEPLRKTGATARAMLLQAGADEWGVDVSTLTTDNGRVLHRESGRAIDYGALAGRAALLPIPADVPLKHPADFRIIGRAMPRIDGRDIVTGEAEFGLDRKIPGMKYASFERCPVIGGRLRTFNADQALKIEGVRAVIPIDGTSISHIMSWANGVAVVADSSWAAIKGREALEIEWDEGENASLNQNEIVAALEERAAEPGVITRDDGDFERTRSGADLEITSDYIAPYLSHSPLETMNCTADVRSDGCEIWAPCQFPNIARTLAERITGMPSGQVQVHISLLGGGFGRRIYADFVGEAVLISKASGAPIQLLWSRADDTRHGFYRPLSHHRMTGTLRSDGSVIGWRHRISGPSRDALRGPDVETPERSEVYAANQFPYSVPNVRVEFNHHYVAIPCGPWRAVAYSQTGFVVESFIDELAVAAGIDPVTFRMRLLKNGQTFTNNETVVDPARMSRVLALAARESEWFSRPLARPQGRGIAVTTDHGACVAHVAEVLVDSSGGLRVTRFVSAIDCGMVVNPDTVAAQVEGSIAFGLSATLKSEITIERGRVVQSSYADYDVVRMGEMPAVEVHIVPSREAPGGVGEPPLPGVAAAVVNAVFAATGKRVRRLPLRADVLTGI